MLDHRFAWMAAVLWTVAILIAILVPSPSLPQSSTPGLDKVAHFGLFLIFSVLWMYAGTGKYLPVWVLLGGLVYGIGTEYAQGLLPVGRTPDPLDAAINAAGTMAGVTIYCLWRWRQSDYNG